MTEIMTKEKIEQWRAMPRSSAAGIAAADEYYDRVILPAAAEEFIRAYQNDETHYENMFLTLGTSWQPLALSIMLHSPRRAVFLGTEDVAPEVEKIIGFIDNPALEYSVEIVDKGSSEKLLKRTAEIYTELADRESTCFDITGGTKAMVAAAAMMAAKLGLDVYYIESRFIPLLRRPEPFSERLVKLEKP